MHRRSPRIAGDLAALSPDDLSFVREVCPSIDEDLRAALRFTNERHVKELLGDRHPEIVGRFTDEIDWVHEGLTSAIRAGISSNTTVHIPHYVEEATHIRRFLG